VNRILIAEDETRIASFLEKGLRAHGFVTTVLNEGETAASVARDEDFDLLILDLGLPDIDGHAVLRRIRERGERLPVIILTARQTVPDKVAGLEGGADDYITKPFAFDELLARVRARLRGSRASDIVMLEANGIRLDLRTRRASVAGKQVELSAKEFLLAETLFRHQGQVLSREQLLSRVWGYDYDPGSNIVDVYVGYLRRKLGPELIETVRGMGYRLG
jgi:DNA-binding response OmpR family regulator